MKRNILWLLVFCCYITSHAQTYNVDPTFNPMGVGASSTVNVIAVQPDGKIVIAGSFSKYNNSSSYSKIVRLNSDGTPDVSFSIGTGGTTTDGSFVNIFAVAIDSDGKILVGGTFTSFNGTPRRSIVRLNNDGSVDNSFNANSSILPWTFNNSSVVRSIAFDAAGKILVGGQFQFYYGSAPRYAFVRLNNDGSMDTSFTNLLSVFSSGTVIQASDIQADGKIIVCGFGVDGVSGVARLNSDGSKDTSFNSSLMVGTVYSVCSISESKMFVGGAFRYGSETYRIFSKLNSDCSEDAEFTSVLASSGSSAVNVINAIKIIGDKIWIGGHFPSYGTYTTPELVRLNLDGSVDELFNIGSGPDGLIKSIAVGQDQKILLGGQFQTFNNVLKPYICRLTDQNLSMDESQLFDQALVVINNFGDFEFHSTKVIKSITTVDALGKILQVYNVSSNSFVLSGIPLGLHFSKVELIDGTIKYVKLLR